MSKRSWISLLISVLLIAGVLLLYREVTRDYDWPPSTEESESASETAPVYTTPREPDIDDRYTKTEAESETKTDSKTETPTPSETETKRDTETTPEPNTTSDTETTPEPDTEPSPDTEPEPDTEPVPPSVDPANGQRLIFLGDSRTVGLYCSQAFSAEEAPAHYFWHIGEEMYAHLGSMTFVAHGGTGFDWLSVYAFARAVTWNEEAPAYIFWFGVNDLQNVDLYIAYINNVAVTYGRPVYYLTLGPSREDSPDGSTNAQIDAFNERLKAGVDPRCRIIDVNSFMKAGLAEGSMHFIDQLHYDYATYRAVFDFIISQLPPQE